MLCTIEQVFRVGPAEGLHGFVGIARKHNGRSPVVQCFDKTQSGKCGVLKIVDNQHSGHHIGKPTVVGPIRAFQHRGAFDQQFGGVKTVLAGIGVGKSVRVFATQRECETPLHRQAFLISPIALREMPRSFQQIAFALQCHAKLIHAGKHVSQLADE